MSLTEEQIGKLDVALAEELAALVQRNPELDEEAILRWTHEQVRHLEEMGEYLPSAPPVEPKAGPEQQDELDALDELWQRAVARLKQELAS